MAAERISEHEIPRELYFREDGAGPFALTDATAVEECDPSFGAMVRLMRADAAAIRARWGGSIVNHLYPALFLAWGHRLSHFVYLRGLRPLAVVITWVLHFFTGAEIRPSAVLGPGLLVVHPSGVVIAGGVIAGEGFEIYGANAVGLNKKHGRHGSPRLGNGVVLGHGAAAFGPIQIGDGAVVGALSLVLDDVAPGAKVKGNPAR